ncbi:MAG: hypothetical protein U0941_24320 [Planctomycetaceae bacterium]
MAEGTTRLQSRSVERIVAWASDAATGDPMAPVLTRIWQGRWLIGTRKQAKSCWLNDRAGLLAKTSWILLLSHPGINVVSAAEVGGECGPIQNYACPKAITGRGLFPTLSKRQGGPRWKSLTIPQCEDARRIPARSRQSHQVQ